jgi:hypothetical protein
VTLERIILLYNLFMLDFENSITEII